MNLRRQTVPRSRPAYIPDANLRAKIAETLRIPPGETLTVADMLKLRRLTANDADIRDLTGLQLASNLTFLSLANNAISDTAPLAGLPRLTTLVLDDNRISDVVPLGKITPTHNVVSQEQLDIGRVVVGRFNPIETFKESLWTGSTRQPPDLHFYL